MVARHIGDIRQLAGLWEGEGTFTSGRTRIQMVTTDADVAEEAHRVLGGSAVLHGPLFYRRPYKQIPAYRVMLDGPEAAGWAMTFYPLMGARRQARITAWLAAWKVRPGKGRSLHGC